MVQLIAAILGLNVLVDDGMQLKLGPRWITSSLLVKQFPFSSDKSELKPAYNWVIISNTDNLYTTFVIYNTDTQEKYKIEIVFTRLKF